MSRVFINLISNGFHATKRRQQELSEPGYQPTLAVSTRHADGRVEVRIRDNGVGIPSTVRDRIFEPFFTTKPPGEGTGLGLSLTYDIVVQQHHGRIDIESEEGEFTEVIVSLPTGADQPDAERGAT